MHLNQALRSSHNKSDLASSYYRSYKKSQKASKAVQRPSLSTLHGWYSAAVLLTTTLLSPSYTFLSIPSPLTPPVKISLSGIVDL